MKEIWKDIEGYDGVYKVSNMGRVRSTTRRVKHGRCGSIEVKGRVLSKVEDFYGYHVVNLTNYKQKKKVMKIHRLVAKAFIPNPENKPEVNHIDGDKKNNYVDNLEWVTAKENRQHAFDIGINESPYKGRLGKSAYNSKVVLKCNKEGEVVCKYWGAGEASRETGIKEGSIRAAIHGYKGRKTAGGFIWKYARQRR